MTATFSRFSVRNAARKARVDSITSSITAGPADDLFLDANALSLATRMMER